MPPLDEGTLMFMPVTSNAISLTEAVEIMKKQDAVLRSFPEVAAVIGKVGRVESPLDPAPINMYETLVELKDRARWRPGLSKDALIAEMTEKSRMPGVTTIWQQPIRNRIDMLATGIPTQVGVKIFGPDLAVLEAKAHAVAAAVREVRGVVDVYPEQILGTPYLEIEVDRDAVARYGATVGDVEDVIAAAVGGMDLTTTIEGRERFAVRVRYARELRDDLAAVRRVLVPVRSPTGVGMAQVPLAELAAIRLRPGPSMISSENGLLRERVFLNVRGRDVGSFVDEAKRVIGQRVPLPPGYFLEWSGQYENQLRARNRLLVVVPACFAIIFVLLWLTYRSAREAAHVILAIPFALTGGNLLLWALHAAAMHYGWKTEFHLSVAVWVGYIALFGTAVQTAVVMVVYLEEALHRKAAAGELTRENIREAAVEGAVLRLRPKLMTVSTVIAGLLPILWSTATGSEVAKPIATPVLGGMLSSLVHVLIVTPVIWTMIKEWELRRGRLDAGAASGLRRSSMTHTNLMAAALAALLLIAAPALAQHEHPQPPAEPPSAPSPEDQSGDDMQGMEGMPGMAGMDHSKHEMHAVLGPYSMTREASGTSWQPDSAPHGGLHRMTGPWELMTHGYAMVVHDDQKGPRGDTRTFSETMWMGMANRPLGPGRLGLRAMVSAEPWTIGKAGYPLLLQTGETANGVTPLVDRQHPHDLFMELSGSYSVPLGSDTADSSAFLYLGLPGEPALGPPAFMHRFSGLDNPEAPLAHHWLDSTHVTFGVATLGWVRGPWKLEGSVFTGREPDQNRTDLESPKMDSWSVRVSFNPAPDWALQASYGHLHSPEQLAPEVDTDRATLSAIYNRPLADGNWQTTLAWGRNARDPGTTTDAWLLESAASRGRHTLFGRAERQGNDELFGHGIAAGGPDRAGEVFTVGKLSLGYIYDVISTESGKLGLGALGSVALIPGELKDVYGNRPVSWLGFVRVRV